MLLVLAQIGGITRNWRLDSGSLERYSEGSNKSKEGLGGLLCRLGGFATHNGSATR